MLDTIGGQQKKTLKYTDTTVSCEWTGWEMVLLNIGPNWGIAHSCKSKEHRKQSSRASLVCSQQLKQVN